MTEHKNGSSDENAAGNQGNEDGSPQSQELEKRRDAVRKILAASGLIAGASGLPKEWTKPVVESVVLPAHAQATGGLSDPCNLILGDVRPSSSPPALLCTVTVNGSVIPATAGVNVTINASSSVGVAGPYIVVTNAAGAYSYTFDILCNEGGSITVTTSIPGDTATCSVVVPIQPTTTTPSTSFTSTPPP